MSGGNQTVGTWLCSLHSYSELSDTVCPCQRAQATTEGQQIRGSKLGNLGDQSKGNKAESPGREERKSEKVRGNYVVEFRYGENC